MRDIIIVGLLTLGVVLLLGAAVLRGGNIEEEPPEDFERFRIDHHKEEDTDGL